MPTSTKRQWLFSSVIGGVIAAVAISSAQPSHAQPSTTQPAGSQPVGASSANTSGPSGSNAAPNSSGSATPSASGSAAPAEDFSALENPFAPSWKKNKGTPLGHNSVRLFDQRTAERSGELHFGLFNWNQWGAQKSDNGWEIGGGVTVLSRMRPFFLGGRAQLLVRVFGDDGLIITPFNYSAEVGASLGPLELFSQWGVSFVNFGPVKGQWSADSLSPRVAAGVALKLGVLRADAALYSEYMWRWFGPDYLIKGLAFTLRVDGGQYKSPLNTEK